MFSLVSLHKAFAQSSDLHGGCSGLLGVVIVPCSADGGVTVHHPLHPTRNWSSIASERKLQEILHVIGLYAEVIEIGVEQA